MSVQDTTNTATTDLATLLHNYGMALIAQATRPTDEGQTALGQAAIAVYEHVDAMADQIRADERTRVAEEIAARIEEHSNCLLYAGQIGTEDARLLAHAAKTAREIGGKP